MLFYYMRHGDPIYTPDSLTGLGERQAEALGRRLSQHGLDEIYVSSSNRAILTAKPTCEILNKEPIVLDWANEHHAWEEVTVTYEDGRRNWLFYDEKYKELFSTNRIRSMGRDWVDAPEFANTTFKAGVNRIQKESDAFFASLGYEHDLGNNCYHATAPNDKRIAFFAHQGFGLLFLSCLLDVPYPIFSTHFDFTRSSMTVIDFPNKPGKVYPKVITLSNDSHLYEANLPTTSNEKLYY